MGKRTFKYSNVLKISHSVLTGRTKNNGMKCFDSCIIILLSLLLLLLLILLLILLLLLLLLLLLFSVVHCPNGCFHHGECVGAVCFCYPGWTGEDCSKFHCHDLHNCSGNGECMGPNVCKCYPGYLVGLLLFCNLNGTDGKLLFLEISMSRNVDLSKPKRGAYVKHELQLNELRNKYLRHGKFEFEPVSK